MTKDRVAQLLDTIERLRSAHPGVPIAVADNGSTDGTPAALAARFSDVEVIEMGANVGVAARNAAVQRVTTPYIAFNDDDSWWEEGALDRVVELFDRYPPLGAITAHVVVEPDGRDDPTSLEMARSPLRGDPGVPGTPVLGFLACATAVRREAFVDVGGFEERFQFVGEEEMLATDLAAAGWEVRYVPDVRVHHAPGSGYRDHVWRRRLAVRNALWFSWLRRPFPAAVRRSWEIISGTDLRAAASGAVDALRGVPWVLRERAVVPPHVERSLELLRRR